VSVEEVECRQVVEVLTDFLEGGMPPAERVRLEQHLAMCEGCMNYLEQLQGTIRLVGRLDRETVPPTTVAELLRVFRAWKAR
jgi:predicted anti-sigma-YlaC factor YlaD